MIVNPDLSEPLKVLDYLYLWLSEMKSANIKNKANMLRVIQVSRRYNYNYCRFLIIINFVNIGN